MGKLTDLIKEQRRRQANSQDDVRLLHWGNLDRKAMCCATVARHTRIKQKSGEAFPAFVDRAMAIAKANANRIVWLQNMYVQGEPPEDWRSMRPYYGADSERQRVHRPLYHRGHPLTWL